MKRNYAVAIDGPVGAGKSTIARQAAKELGFYYVDTGAIYRTVGYHMTLMGIGPRDVDGITRLIDDVNLKITYDENGLQHMLLNGMDVTEEIRTPEASMVASGIAAQPVVRAYLLEVQRELAREHSVVMDGRDIGTVVLPNADVKIFLTAAPEIRARRRYDELIAKGKQVTFDEVLRDLNARDAQDANRAIAPLKCAKDAVRLDTSALNFAGSVAAVRRIIEEKIK